MNREEILREYPFLKPYPMNPEYLNEDTALMIDSIPDGWMVFIWDMVKEIKECLIENNCLNEYMLCQVKEKYGSLRWYDNLTCTQDIISKYEDIAYHTCCVCGKEATKYSKGWILPFCDKCYSEVLGK